LFFSAFLGLMGPSVASGSSEVVSPDDGLWAVFGSVCPLGRLQLGPEVTHSLFVQGGQICCCFHQVAAVLPYHYNSVWLVPTPARWGQFNFEYCPQSQKCSSGIHCGLAFGGWPVTPPQLSAFDTCLTLVLSKFGFLPHLHSLRQVHCWC
jgi:hypothetical protein